MRDLQPSFFGYSLLIGWVVLIHVLIMSDNFSARSFFASSVYVVPAAMSARLCKLHLLNMDSIPPFSRSIERV